VAAGSLSALGFCARAVPARTASKPNTVRAEAKEREDGMDRR
jgi:hypothetical protein